LAFVSVSDNYLLSMSRNTRNTKDSTSDNVAAGGVAVDMEKLESLVEKAVAAAVAVIHNEFSSLISELTDRIDSAEKRLENLESTVERESSEELTKSIQSVREEAREYARWANDAEQQSRQNNLRIRGLQTTTENCREAVLSFCRTILYVQLSDDDIVETHVVPSKKQRNTNAQDDTAQSAARSNSINVPVVLVRFRNQRVRNTVISRRKVLKGTKNSVVEDLTALNVSTLNRLQKDALVAKCWSWNGRLFASTTNARVLLVKPFQLIQECLDITR